MKIAMIMLAAGNSRRFGSNKLLYKIEGIPMYERTLRVLFQAKKILEYSRDSAVQEIKITVVTQYKEIGEYALSLGAEVLYNPHPENGISSSLKIGLEANRKTADACLFCVSDQPWLTSETLCGLISKFINSGKEIACVTCGGKLGNPCIFSERYYGELLALEGDRGGKRIVNAHKDDAEIIEIFDKRELEDIDFLKE